jgi:hypothetical protein
MTMRQFIKDNRKELDRCIFNALYHRDQSPCSPLNDKERELWILNDQGLYNWARSEGVKI